MMLVPSPFISSTCIYLLYPSVIFIKLLLCNATSGQDINQEFKTHHIPKSILLKKGKYSRILF